MATKLKRQKTLNNSILREIMERLRDYEPDEVAIICNKYRQKRNMPPLEPEFLHKMLPPKEEPPQSPIF